MGTTRLELEDATLREWTATVIAVDPEQGIVLVRSAFYPGGGGQPPDHGVLLWGGVQTRIEGAAHFHQEDRGVQVADAMIAAFGGDSTPGR